MYLIEPFLALFFWLLFGHFLADYPLQGEFLAKAKDRTSDLGKIFWRHALFAHSFIHAGTVAFITGHIWMGLAEFFIHAITDDLKCIKKINMAQDQTIHIVTKLVWAYLTVYLY